jgi:ribose 5-phosphate isomerase A
MKDQAVWKEDAGVQRAVRCVFCVSCSDPQRSARTRSLALFADGNRYVSRSHYRVRHDVKLAAIRNVVEGNSAISVSMSPSLSSAKAETRFRSPHWSSSCLRTLLEIMWSDKGGAVSRDIRCTAKFPTIRQLLTPPCCPGPALQDTVQWMKRCMDQFKKIAAEAAVTQVKDGMIVGLGTGSTATYAVDALGKLVQNGLRITGIPTSEQTARQAQALGIPLATLEEQTQVDLTIDGADEVERGSLNLLKGQGGALLREKIVASASTRLVIIVDETKLVDRLGSRSAVPVEVVPFGWQVAARNLRELGATVSVRRGDEGRLFVSDGGHYILDCAFGPIAAPASLEQKLNSIVGVVEHGLFMGMTSEVIVGGPGGVKVLLPERR